MVSLLLFICWCILTMTKKKKNKTLLKWECYSILQGYARLGFVVLNGMERGIWIFCCFPKVNMTIMVWIWECTTHYEQVDGPQIFTTPSYPTSPTPSPQLCTSPFAGACLQPPFPEDQADPSEIFFPLSCEYLAISMVSIPIFLKKDTI